MSGLVKGFKGLVIPTGMELNTSSVSVEIGTTYQLIPIFTPNNPTNNKIYWTSSNTSVATVNDKGLVTSVSPGSVIITAVADYGGYTDTCNCQIFKIDVTGISLNENSIVLGEGDTFQLEATVVPSNASLKGVVWSSSNTNYATVDSNGLVTYIAPGDCTITVTTVDGGYTATCACSSRIRVTSIELNKTAINVKAGETSQLVATIAPNNATLKTVAWSSSNTSVATVSQNGLVTYVGDGNCTITATTVDGGYTATCEVECTSFTPIDCCFGYTGAQQSIILQPHLYCLEVWGASGYCCSSYSAYRGGGYSSGCIDITNQTTFYVYVGGHPTGKTGGWNGGGNGYSSYGTGGGGGTDIRVGGNSLCHRIIVAGGSGGNNCSKACTQAQGGAGGGAYGMEGCSNTYCPIGLNRSGGGASQTSGGCAWSSSGSKGTFGQGGTSCSGYNAGGGGGGWYGGGGAYDNDSDNDGRGGGGGSGYTWTASTCSSHPVPACLSGVPYLTNAICCPGCVSFTSPDGLTEAGHFGHGCVRIRSL